MSQGHGRETCFGAETRKSGTAAGFAECYWCSDSSEVAWNCNTSWKRAFTLLREKLNPAAGCGACESLCSNGRLQLGVEMLWGSRHLLLNLRLSLDSPLLTPLLLSASASARSAVQRTSPANPTGLGPRDGPSATKAFGSRAKEIGWMG